MTIATHSATPQLPPLSALLRVPDAPLAAGRTPHPHGEREVTAAARAALARHAAASTRAVSTCIPAVRIDKIHPGAAAGQHGHGHRRSAVALIAAGVLLVLAGGIAQHATRVPARTRPAPARVARAHRAPPIARAASPVGRIQRPPVAVPVPASAITYHGPYTSPLTLPAWLAATSLARWYQAPVVGVARHQLPTWRALAPVAPSRSAPPPAAPIARTRVARRAPTPSQPPVFAPPSVPAPPAASRLTIVSVPAPAAKPAGAPAAAVVKPAAPLAAAPAHPAPATVAAPPAPYRVVTFVSPTMVLVESKRDGRKWVSAYTVGQRLPDGRTITAIDPASHRLSTN